LKSSELKTTVKELAETVDQLKAALRTQKKTVKKLESGLQAAQDIEAIKKLQRSYSYYLEHWEEEQLLGLWSHSSDITAEINDSGQYKGWEQVKRYFHFPYHYSAYEGLEKAPPEYLHIGMPIGGIVDLDKGGKTAKGRWYGLFLVAQPRGGKFGAFIGTGIWENEYIKEEGIWKLKKIFWNDIFSCPWEDGWVKTPVLENLPPKDRPAPGPNTHYLTYPSGYVFPYHYKHPVTGK
jgi:hypothetical protein